MTNRTLFHLFFSLMVIGLLLGGAVSVYAQDDGADPTETEPLDLRVPAIEGYSASGDNSYCLVCHGGLADQEALINWAQVGVRTTRSELASVVHNTHVGEAAACLDCHPANIFPHDAPRQLGEGLYAAADYTESCIGCHHEQSENIEGACNDCHDASYVIEADTAVLNVEVSECEACHATTVTEWANSAHGDQQLACDSCHFPHQQEVRFGDVETLCLNCHDQSRDEYVHVTHAEQTCSDCHVYQGFDQTFHVLTVGGMVDTGHHNQVSTAACTDCHSQFEVTDSDDPVEVAMLQHPLEAQAEIDALEGEISDIRENREEESARLLVQAMIVGLALGAILVWLGLRLLQRRLDEPPASHE